MGTISFTSEVKEELCSLEYDSFERISALLSAYIRINSHISFKNKKTLLILESYNAKIAKFIYKLLSDRYNAKIALMFLKRKELKKGLCYHIEITDIADDIIKDLEIDFLDGKISKNIVKDDNSIAGYLAGAFLACGSINPPSSSNYHLELAFSQENYAKWVSHLFGRYKNTNIEPKIAKRRNHYVLYIKKSDKISDFLIMIGAVNACLEFENARVDRDYFNNTNRLMNLDTANMTKTIKTSEKQIKDIKVIEKKIGFNNLANEKMKILCKIRLENESASMNDLASLMSEKMGINVSKSNIAHLFRAISKLAGDLN